jgi:pilus assembly protein Flp/PilA
MAVVTIERLGDWQRRAAACLFARCRSDDRGASLVEYALLVALIAMVCIVAIAFVGQSASSRFSNVGSSVNG